MYNFILQTFVMVSLGAMIYLLARAMPRVTETVRTDERKDYLNELMKKLPLEKADALVTSWLEKFLRKTKVIILKLDNLLTEHLKKLRPSIDSGEKERPNLFEKKDENNIV